MDSSTVDESLNIGNMRLIDSNEIETSVSESGRMDSTSLKEQDVEDEKQCDVDDQTVHESMDASCESQNVEDRKQCDVHDQTVHESTDTSCKSQDVNGDTRGECSSSGEVNNSNVDLNDDDVVYLGSFDPFESGITSDEESLPPTERVIKESNGNHNSNYNSEYMHQDDDESEDDYLDCESVLFLSIGNICRAPMAAAILISLIRRRKLDEYWAVDSAALAGLHINESIDARASKCLMDYDVYNSHKCRLVKTRDFQIFRYYFCMDELDLLCVEQYLPPEFDKSRIKLLGDLHPDGPVELEDPCDSPPYYDGRFHSVYHKILACVTQLVDQQSGPDPNDHVPAPIKMSDSEDEEEFEDEDFFGSDDELPGGQYMYVDLIPTGWVVLEDSKSSDEASSNEEDINKFDVPFDYSSESDCER